MSIIYDALQKTQKAREQSQSRSRVISVRNNRFQGKKWGKRLLMLAGFSLVVTGLGFGVSWSKSWFGSFNSVLLSQKIQSTLDAYFAKPIQIQKPVIAESEFKAKHLLNGIFVSPNETVAMINNKLVHLGDVVDGMRVSSIDELGVQLRHDDQVIYLHAVM